MKIIKHGSFYNKPMTFVCLKCKCEFEANYGEYNLSGSFNIPHKSVFFSTCPECGRPVPKVIKDVQIYQNMKQYCRYCNNANLIGEYEFYCQVKNECYGEAKGKRVNKCKNFEFNPYDLYSPGDTFREYKPRGEYKKHEKSDDLEQIEMKME